MRDVKASVGIPVAVKLSPFWSNLADMAARLESAGADGLVLFNRFYQPDIDPENLQVRRALTLSSPGRAAAAAALDGAALRAGARCRWPSPAACTTRGTP